VLEDSVRDIERGTRITLQIRDDSSEYFDTLRIRSLIAQYSEFIAFPIKLWLSDENECQVEDTKMTYKRQSFENKKAYQEGRRPFRVEPVYKTRWQKEWKYTVVNACKPI
jgi:heat shock protein beta